MSARTRAPGRLGTRGFTVASVLVATAVVLQSIGIAVASGFASREVDQAAADTYGYVGDLTVDKVAQFADSGKALVDDTALFLTFSPDLDRVALTEYMAQRLSRTDNVRAVYVGWNDGAFLAVSRTDVGFESQWVAPGSGAEVVENYNAELVLLSEREIASDYDPRTRPWFTTAQAVGVGVWSEPYLDYRRSTTIVSPAAPVVVGDSTVAVVAADLNLPVLRELLDDLPFGEGAEAFVLSSGMEVLGAPAQYADRLEDISTGQGRVPTVQDLGLEVTTEELVADESQLTRVEDRIVLDRAVSAESGVDWQVHLTAEVSQLSTGLGRVASALWWVFGLALLVSGLAAVVAWRVSHSMGRMRVRASTDQLTGLANRHEYVRAGQRMLNQAAIRGDRLLAVVLDLDDFKAINDDLGHDVGDAALVATGQALRTCVRYDDVAARLGGDEFVVLQRLRPQDDPDAIVERLRGAIEEQLSWLTAETSGVGVTAGYALSEPHMDLRQLVALADAALVDGKRLQKGAAHRA